jgi:cystathionine beta-lyase/cystathionine gamma-synthase
MNTGKLPTSASMTHKAVPEDEQRRQGITPGLVRLAVGCEEFDDLLTDLAQAMAGVGVEAVANP